MWWSSECGVFDDGILAQPPPHSAPFRTCRPLPTGSTDPLGAPHRRPFALESGHWHGAVA
jgi:hypothetical protein